MKTPEEIKNIKQYRFEDLCDIMRLLRAENGCPWDREQTHTTIRNNMLEEAYEAAEAIDLDDPALLCEELGDVILQAVFHARIAEESGRFSMDDVLNGICEKLVVRHPHIFGDVKADNAAEVLSNWDAIKQQTKKRKNVGEELDGICRALPALMRSEKIASKLRKRSLSPQLQPVEGKTLSELNENEIGDALFALVSLASEKGLSAEELLQKTNEGIIRGVSK
ncbi:MAG: MazG family protein [Ruminococcaceae bacterium]|nr:MazG family protein [Oscillospiraceae bacterium]